MTELKITDTMRRHLTPGNIVVVLYDGQEDWTLWFVGTVISITYKNNGTEFALDLLELETRNHHQVSGKFYTYGEECRPEYTSHMVLKLAENASAL